MRFAFTFVTFHIIVNTGIAWELAEIMLWSVDCLKNKNLKQNDC